MPTSRDRKKVTFANDRLVRDIEDRDDSVNDTFRTSWQRREPVKDGGGPEVTATDILHAMRPSVSALQRNLKKGAGSSEMLYDGPDPAMRDDSRRRYIEASGKIAHNRQVATAGTGEDRVRYRMEFATGKLAGNSLERAIGVKDLAEEQGFAACVVRIHLKAHANPSGHQPDFYHHTTLVAHTNEQLPGPGALPDHRDPNTANLAMFDCSLKTHGTYGTYPERAMGRLIELESGHMKLMNEQTGARMSPVTPGFSESLKALSRSAEVLHFDKLPNHALEYIRTEQRGKIETLPPAIRPSERDAAQR